MNKKKEYFYNTMTYEVHDECCALINHSKRKTLGKKESFPDALKHAKLISHKAFLCSICNK